jgi:hypothetical protein
MGGKYTHAHRLSFSYIAVRMVAIAPPLFNDVRIMRFDYKRIHVLCHRMSDLLMPLKKMLLVCLVSTPHSS